MIARRQGLGALGEGFGHAPPSTRDTTQTASRPVWDYKGPKPAMPTRSSTICCSTAIRQDKPYNETERCAKAAMAGILGRMAAESGKMITWDEAMASKLELAPGLDGTRWIRSRRCCPTPRAAIRSPCPA